MKRIMVLLLQTVLFVSILSVPLSAQWPNHKMHYPQLPDLIGWDVNATSSYPPPGNGVELADDWRCTSTGPVSDIHFWGSWKDQDGIPGTDDFESNMPWFTLRIWSNNPGPPSAPDSLLWEWTGEIPGVPSEPPTLEGWYDPSVTVPPFLFYNDHIPYWRYDFVLPSGYPPFMQQQDSIYWLSVTAHLVNPAAYHWGWKNSRDHFMDNAAFRLSPIDPWGPLYEPPRFNIFHGYFDTQGNVWEDSMSTNFYGDGWYLYPSGWQNIWFYDNPYTPDHPKYIELVVNVTPYFGSYYYIPGDVNSDGIVDLDDLNYLGDYLGGGPPPPYVYPGTSFYAAADANGDCAIGVTDFTYLSNYLYIFGPAPVFCPTYPPSGLPPSVTFAINYSTDLWSTEGVPGRPPLPSDPETYIVRESFPVVIGDSTFITLNIPYNPEWVSIDVMANDVVIDGWIKHECVTTSMDMAFVITGPEEEIPTLNEWGMLILALLLLAAGTIAVVRRRKRVRIEN